MCRFKGLKETECYAKNGISVTVETFTNIDTQEKFACIGYKNSYGEEQYVGLLEAKAIENLINELQQFLKDAKK